MELRKTIALASCILAPVGFAPAGADGLTPEQALGRRLFFDSGLSTPPGQGCFTCHAPAAGFADPDRSIPVSDGILPGRVGNRNAPSAAYAAYSPRFHFDEKEGHYVGGQFWDGRAATLEEQAKGPFLNPLEMANPDAAAVVLKVRESGYGPDFERVYGPGALEETDPAYERIARAIAAFERSAEMNPFSSKYDRYLRGEAKLTEQERRGLDLFVAEDKGNCAACHPVSAEPDGTPPLLTDFTYDNLGVPGNPANPFYRLPADLNPDGEGFVDRGLGKPTGDPAQDGKHKVPTLRNVALTAPYMHNGAFATLDEVVDFYNSRDTDPRWAPPELVANVNREELGDLKLTPQEVADIVAFMGTLTDGWRHEDRGEGTP